MSLNHSVDDNSNKSNERYLSIFNCFYHYICDVRFSMCQVDIYFTIKKVVNS